MANISRLPTFLQEEDDDGSSYYGSPQPRANQEDMLTPGQVYLNRLSDPDPDPYWIRIQSGRWIQEGKIDPHKLKKKLGNFMF
jgi:hypothetical protein